MDIDNLREKLQKEAVTVETDDGEFLAVEIEKVIEIILLELIEEM